MTGVVNMMLGSGTGVVTVPVGNYSAVASGSASCTVRFNPDGTYEVLRTGQTTLVGNWLTPAALAPGGYTLRATLTGGAGVTGSFDSDLPMTSARAWGASATFPDQAGGSVLFEFKLAGSVVASGEIVIAAAPIP